jgi:hypothetical protein
MQKVSTGIILFLTNYSSSHIWKREGEEWGELTKDKVRGQKFTKLGRKY